MKQFLQIIGIILWVCGGGMLLGVIFTGLPLAVALLLGAEIISWIWNSVPQIIIVIGLFFLLYYGFTTKANLKMLDYRY